MEELNYTVTVNGMTKKFQRLAGAVIALAPRTANKPAINGESDYPILLNMAAEARYSRGIPIEVKIEKPESVRKSEKFILIDGNDFSYATRVYTYDEAKKKLLDDFSKIKNEAKIRLNNLCYTLQKYDSYLTKEVSVFQPGSEDYNVACLAFKPTAITIVEEGGIIKPALRREGIINKDTLLEIYHNEGSIYENGLTEQLKRLSDENLDIALESDALWDTLYYKFVQLYGI